jgi:tryptophanyl-tRNA synthetase
VTDQDTFDCTFCVVDLHALTVPQDPEALRTKSLQLAMKLMAVGIDPDRSTLFVQSHVHEHVELAWICECTVSFGELSRMTQFKDKSARSEFISGALFTYPALMAADILVHDTDRVPVGDDQRQHLEITRDIAERFNGRYGETFVVPEAYIPPAGARVMDLQTPTNKMSKSNDSPQGTIDLLDEPAVVEKKVKRAVTDSGDDVTYDPETRPGVANLLSILAAATGREPKVVAEDYTQFGPLKKDTAEALVALLEPIQARYRELEADPAATQALLKQGAEKARAKAAEVVARAKDAVGLLPA